MFSFHLQKCLNSNIVFMADFKPDFNMSSSLKELAPTWGLYIAISSNKNINLYWVGLAV